MTDRLVTKRRERRPDDRPAEILAAALDLFVERGFSATRMEDVASRAGLSKAAIYLYFKDKTALLEALVGQTVLANLGRAQMLAAHHQGPVADLLAQVIGFMAQMVSESRVPDLVKLVISESRAHPEIGKFYLENVVQQGLPMFEELFRRGIAAGEFRKDLDPGLTARSLVAPMLLGIVWRTVFEPLGASKLDVEAFAVHHRDLLLRGIRA